MSELYKEPEAMSLEQAAKSVGMPEANPNDVRTPEGRAAFEADLVASADSDLNSISDRAATHNQLASGRRPLNMRARVAAGVALSAATLVTPQGQELAKTVAEPVVEVAKSFNDNLDNDRVFNPDAGNPSNAAEIVSSWDEDPSKTVVIVDDKYAKETTPSAEQVSVQAEVSPQADVIERQAQD